MPPQTVTFPCPFCGRRMGVPAELLGKQVRCPHCKQVVLAPVNTGPSGVVPAVVPPPAPAPHPAQPDIELPTFAMQRKEGADSILGDPDESEDEVFGSQTGVRGQTAPPLDLTNPTSPPVDSSRPTPPDDNPFELASSTAATAPTQPPPSRPVSPTGPTQGPTAELPNPFLELEPVTLPAVFAAPAAPVPATQPLPAPAPVRPVFPTPAPLPVPSAPTPASNPFADIEETGPAPAPAPAPEPVTEELDDQPRRRRKKRDDEPEPEPEEKPKRGTRTRAALPPASGTANVLLFVVIAYAVLVTGLAVYGLFFKSGEKFETGHPLSTIPDNFGEYDPAARKKVSQYKFPVDGDLPAQQRAALGEKLVIGQLEVQPLRIERRLLVIDTETTLAKRSEPTRSESLVLTMLIKNMSDLTFHPMDPAFLRRQNDAKKDFPITRVVVDKKTFFSGGYLDWPIDYNKVKKKIERQQTNDAIPLSPNESREYVVFTDARPEIVAAVVRGKDTMQWRVEVRRAPVEVDGKEIPVTAIIGVDFRATDVKIKELTRDP